MAELGLSFIIGAVERTAERDKAEISEEARSIHKRSVKRKGGKCDVEHIEDAFAPKQKYNPCNVLLVKRNMHNWI